jgi:hypothetical protein
MNGTTNIKAVVARSWETRSSPKDSRSIASDRFTPRLR